MSEKLEKILVEKVDILSEMESLNKSFRDLFINGDHTEEQVKAYDVGVQNTMSILESLIDSSEIDGYKRKKDRIIFQKYGEESKIRRYVKLSDVLKELYGGD